MTTKVTVGVSRKSSSSAISRVALLAGSAAALPLAGHADPIYYSGPQSISETATFVTGDQPYTVDLANDNFSGYTFTAEYTVGNKQVYVTPQLPTSYYVGDSAAAGSNPTALAEGDLISSSSIFTQGAGTIQSSTGGGNWPADGTAAFLGVEFTDTNPGVGTSANSVYCGWVELGAQTANGDSTFTIDGWAYDQGGCSIEAGQTGPGTFVPNPSTPEPASLALFALGSAGVLAWRAHSKATRA